MIAASDTVILSEEHSYMNFFDELPPKLVWPVPGSSVGVSMVEDSILFCDNTATVKIIRDLGEEGLTKPRSRHYALRHLRVAEYAAPGRLYFCPTTLQKADALTKIDVAQAQRRMLLFNDCVQVSEQVEEESSEEEQEDVEVNSVPGYMLFQDSKVVGRIWL